MRDRGRGGARPGRVLPDAEALGEAALTAPAPAVLIYDGECAMCRASALWLLRRAMNAGADALDVMPCRSPARHARFPQVSEEACLRAMHLVLPDGQVLVGADAVPAILRRVPRWRWVARAFDIPGARRVARRVYRWIADNRMQLSCRVPGGPARSSPS